MSTDNKNGGFGKPSAEGWDYLQNTRKWHYFVNGRSLCGKWLGLGLRNLVLGNGNSPDNCAKCVKRLKKKQEKDKQ